MNRNLKLVVNNVTNNENTKYFFEKNELKIILDLYAKMVSEGSWKDYGLSISSKQVSFSVFKNAAENAIYKICKNFKPSNKNLRYLITDTNGKILKNSFEEINVWLFYFIWSLLSLIRLIKVFRLRMKINFIFD